MVTYDGYYTTINDCEGDTYLCVYAQDQTISGSMAV